MSRRVDAFVPGAPAPQGSKRLVRGVMIETCPRLHVWRDDCALLVRSASRGLHWPRSQPVTLRADFRLPRPAQPRHTYPPRPDLDKLLRALCDALTASGVIADDSQIVRIEAGKRYCTRQDFVGVHITISEANDG